MMAPASATYQQAVPIPLMAPLRMRYYTQSFVRVCPFKRKLGAAVTHPLVSELAVAVVCRTLDREGHGTDHQSPFDTDFVHDRATHETDWML
jgi:hypothetical protein